MFDFACDLLGHELVTEFTGCRRIARTEPGESAFDGTVYVAEDGSRWVRVGPMANLHLGAVRGWLHGNRICNHP